jgi:hypothetical protein
MRTAAIACLVLSILALTLATWGSLGIGTADSQIVKGLSAAEIGVAKNDLQATATGIDAAHWGEKNLFVSHAFETLGRVGALAFLCVSLLLLIVPKKKKRPNQAPEPTAHL